MKTLHARNVLRQALALWVICLPLSGNANGLAPAPGFSPKITFSESYSEPLITTRFRDDDGEGHFFTYYEYEKGATRSGSVTLIASMTEVDLASIDESTEVGFTVGGFEHSATLGGADVLSLPGRRAVFYETIPDENDPNGLREIRVAAFTYSWNSKTLTITASFNRDSHSIATDDYSGQSGAVSGETASAVKFGIMAGARRIYVKGTAKISRVVRGRHVEEGEVFYDYDDFHNSVSLTGTADFAKPACSIAAPKAGLRVPESSGPNVLVTGTASDGAKLEGVQVRINGGAWSPADLVFKQVGKNELDEPIFSDKIATWSATVAAVPGPNVIEAIAGDPDLNESKTANRIFNYVVPATLNVALDTAEGGSVTRGFVGTSSREEGVSYTVTATPKAGFVFDGWTSNSSIAANTPVLKFVMTQGLALTAKFAPNPFGAAGMVASYRGLIENPDDRTHSTGGALNFNLTKVGGYSGTLFAGGEKFTLRGLFTASGFSTVLLTRKDKTTFALNMTLALDGSGLFTGALSEGGIVFTALTGGKHGFSATSKFAGPSKYTLALPPLDPAAPNAPVGYGYATVAISTTGGVTITGVLADGTTWSNSSALLGDLSIPVYLPLYGGKGSIYGWLTLRDVPDISDLDGPLFWSRPANAADPAYPLGFEFVTPALGSVFATPSPGSRILSGLDTSSGVASISLSGGGIGSDVLVPVTVSTAHVVKVTDANPHSLRLTVNKTTGLLSGSYKHPVDNKVKSIGGVVLQKQDLGSGLTRGVPDGGAFQLIPETEF